MSDKMTELFQRFIKKSLGNEQAVEEALTDLAPHEVFDLMLESFDEGFRSAARALRDIELGE